MNLFNILQLAYKKIWHLFSLTYNKLEIPLISNMSLSKFINKVKLLIFRIHCSGDHLIKFSIPIPNNTERSSSKFFMVEQMPIQLNKRLLLQTKHFRSNFSNLLKFVRLEGSNSLGQPWTEHGSNVTLNSDFNLASVQPDTLQMVASWTAQLLRDANSLQQRSRERFVGHESI